VDQALLQFIEAATSGAGETKPPKPIDRATG